MMAGSSFLLLMVCISMCYLPKSRMAGSHASFRGQWQSVAEWSYWLMFSGTEVPYTFPTVVVSILLVLALLVGRVMSHGVLNVHFLMTELISSFMKSLQDLSPFFFGEGFSAWICTFLCNWKSVVFQSLLYLSVVCFFTPLMLHLINRSS